MTQKKINMLLCKHVHEASRCFTKMQVLDSSITLDEIHMHPLTIYLGSVVPAKMPINEPDCINITILLCTSLLFPW